MLLAERHHSTGTTLGADSRREYVALLPLSDTYATSTLHRCGTGATATARANAETSAPAAPVQPTVAAAAAAAVPHAAPDGVQPEPSSLALSATTGDPATPLPDTLGVMLVSVGLDPFRLMRRLVHESTVRLRAQLGERVGAVAETPTAPPTTKRANEEEDEEEEETVAEFVDTFGWCTWDSFYTMVTPEGAVLGINALIPAHDTTVVVYKTRRRSVRSVPLLHIPGGRCYVTPVGIGDSCL